MNEIILTNHNDRNFKNLLTELSAGADQIKIASAFFSDTEFITKWLKDSKKIDLLVSLRPPTNYYSLKEIQPKSGINIQFLDDRFHSKFYIFYKNFVPFSCVIGSSNFTNGGLCTNIETNVILTDKEFLFEIDKQFNDLWSQSFLLQPTDLETFKIRFDNFKERNEKIEKEQGELQIEKLAKRTKKLEKTKFCKEASQYLAFWKVVDEVKDLVIDISKKEFPNIPIYLSVDHFWHWVKTVWSKENQLPPTKELIPKMFQEFCNWDKSNKNFTNEMARNSELISKLLSPNHVDSISLEEAKLIYSKLHSGSMRARRFKADEKFVKENSLQKIRESLKYLLDSEGDDVVVRITNLCVNPKYKLSQLNSSGVQEIIGWVNPEKFPLRNNKADEALKILGREII